MQENNWCAYLNLANVKEPREMLFRMRIPFHCQLNYLELHMVFFTTFFLAGPKAKSLVVRGTGFGFNCVVWRAKISPLGCESVDLRFT